MPLIKANFAPAKLSPFSMADIEKQAMAILLRAQQKAEQVLAEAQHAGDDLRGFARAQGRTAGHEEGLAKGIEEGRRLGHEQAISEHREQLTTAVAALTTAMEQFDLRRRELESGAV